MATYDTYIGEIDDSVAIVHVVSDSGGDTAYGVVHAAAVQFSDDSIEIHRLSELRNIADARDYFDREHKPGENTAVFHTIADYNLRLELKQELDRRGIPSIDLLGPAISIMSTLTGQEPKSEAGIELSEDKRFDRRVSGMEFFAAHDDGQKTDDLMEADAVLFGVPRTSKTPLSLYLAFLGYKVANLNYTLDAEIPEELFKVNPRRVFGLVRSGATLANMQEQGISDGAVLTLAGSYANPETSDVEQEQAKEIMNKIGCDVIEVDGKSVEEIAAVVLERLMEFTSTKL